MAFGRNKPPKPTEFEKAQESVLPAGCYGRVSTTPQNSEEKGSYRIATHLGCPGLLDGIVEVRVGDYKKPNHHSFYESNDLDAVKNAAAHILDACGNCPLGQTGHLREEARLRLASEDEITQKLKIAQLEHDTAELMKETAAAKLAALNLQQQLT